MALMGLVAHPGRVVGGSVEFLGTDLAGLESGRLNRIRGKEVAMVFQDPMSSLNPVLTVEQQIAAPLKRHLGIGGAATRARALELLQQVGIPAPAERLQAYPHQLSGGMRQRVLLAMALSCGPRLLLADEPTTALDVTVQAQIIALLNGLADQMNMAVIFVTHDLGLVARFADRVAVMYAGRFVEVATTTTLFARPQHPYTRGLLASIPAITGERPARLSQIPGSPPDVLNPGPGCPFEPRCAYAIQSCTEQRPALEPRGAANVACWVDAETAPSRILEVAHV
jgi:oligopeptide/dipeptide ABC transporter ATP-binding protein